MTCTPFKIVTADSLRPGQRLSDGRRVDEVRMSIDGELVVMLAAVNGAVRRRSERFEALQSVSVQLDVDEQRDLERRLRGVGQWVPGVGLEVGSVVVPLDLDLLPEAEDATLGGTHDPEKEPPT